MKDYQRILLVISDNPGLSDFDILNKINESGEMTTRTFKTLVNSLIYNHALVRIGSCLWRKQRKCA